MLKNFVLKLKVHERGSDFDGNDDKRYFVLRFFETPMEAKQYIGEVESFKYNDYNHQYYYHSQLLLSDMTMKDLEDVVLKDVAHLMKELGQLV